MKKKILAVILAAVCLVAVFLISGASGVPETKTVAAETRETTPLETRFLNMLNHNFVYGEDFASYDKIASGCVLSVLSSKEGDYVNENYVKGFASDMYGIEFTSFGKQDDAHAKPGYIYVPPKGYATYSHTNARLNKNEDGTYTVLTDVLVCPHDDLEYTATAVSLFVPSEKSPFGFILSRSDISENAISF